MFVMQSSRLLTDIKQAIDTGLEKYIRMSIVRNLTILAIIYLYCIAPLMPETQAGFLHHHVFMQCLADETREKVFSEKINEPEWF